jgi:hypothetical protein
VTVSWRSGSKLSTVPLQTVIHPQDQRPMRLSEKGLAVIEPLIALRLVGVVLAGP